MNESDLDIVLAIADGTLTGKARQDALARISENPDLADGLRAQIDALDALGELDQAPMTASERTTLRTNLIEQLNLEPVAPVVAIKARRPWWQPVAGLVSAAALVMAIIVVPGMLSGDESSTDVAAVAPESATLDDAVGTSMAADAPSAESDAPGGASVADAAADDVIALPEMGQEDVLEFFSDMTTPRDTTGSTNTATTDTASGALDDEATTESVDEVPIEVGTPLATAAVTVIGADVFQACLDALAEDLPQGKLIPQAATTTADGIVIHLGTADGDRINYSVSILLRSCTITSVTP